MDKKEQVQGTMVEEFWRQYFTEGPPKDHVRKSRFYRYFPADTRCKWCLAPFDGVPGAITKNVFQTFPSKYNPHYCNVCDDFANKYQGGAEFPLTMLFADIRGSSVLAEKIGSKEFSDLINRFFIKSTHVLTGFGAMIEKLVGDEITAIFSRGLVGDNYFGEAIEAAKLLLKETGHGEDLDPWVPVGIGIHSGKSFLGSVGKPNGIMEVAALGEVPNTASRLASLAGPGEILVSESTIKAAKIDPAGFEKRHLELKGRENKIAVFVIRV